MTTPTPAAEWAIDEPLVRELLRAQHPDLAGLPLELLDSGFDNVMYRLGGELLVRLPRRAIAVPLLHHEQTWLPEMARWLPIAVPAPVRIGVPSERFPRPWSVLPWLPGRPADLEPPEAAEAARWAGFLRALHRPAPPDAPENAFRGCPLRDRQPAIEQRLAHLREATDSVPPSIDALWADALEAPPAHRPLWLHGDLHARNVLVERGHFTGVVDWGDLTSGDVATDLASVWMLFEEPAARAAVLERYEPNPPLLRRARGWAVSFGALLLDTGLVDHPRHAARGAATLRRLAADASALGWPS